MKIKTLNLMEKLLKLAADILKGWNKLVIFVGLGFFAVYVGIEGLNNLTDSKAFIILSIIFCIVSFAEYKFYPEKFPYWNIRWTIKLLKSVSVSKPKLNRGMGLLMMLYLVIILVASPLSGILKSLGLSFYILTFFNPEVSNLWKEVYANNSIYGILVKLFIVPLVFVFFGVILPMMFISFMEKAFGKSIFTKYAIYIWLLIFSIIVIILLSNNILWVKNMDKEIYNIFLVFISFVIGFVPLGWFSELFIGSIIKEEGKIPETN